MEGKLLADVVVLGKPVGQGSLVPFKSKTTGKTIMPQLTKVLSWRQAAAHVLLEDYRRRWPMSNKYAGAVALRVMFVYERPKSHYYTDKKRAGQLREDAPDAPTYKCDIDKLLRAVGDALTVSMLVDDGLVRGVCMEKGWGAPASVMIRVFSTSSQEHCTCLTT